MMVSMIDAAELLKALRDRYPVDDLRPQRGFGSDALTTDGRIFAAVTKGKLLLKLPEQRVTALIGEQTGEPFVMRGKAMRQWVLIPTAHVSAWPALADEAYRFVAAA